MLCPYPKSLGKSISLPKFVFLMAHKKSIRFFNDRQVRAVWDEENSKWWFSAIDIVRAINDEDDYVKAGNYWRWLKRKLTGEGVQLVSVTHEFKFEAPDRKQRASDALDTRRFIGTRPASNWNPRSPFLNA